MVEILWTFDSSMNTKYENYNVFMFLKDDSNND